MSQNVETMNPPNRPNSNLGKEFPVEQNNFYMDFENSCLTGWSKPIPKGKTRHEDPEWQKHIQSQVYPNHSDIDWWEYREWVLAGGGDEWFVDP